MKVIWLNKQTQAIKKRKLRKQRADPPRILLQRA